MATQTTPVPRAEDEAALAGQIRVAVPEHTFRSDLRAVSMTTGMARVRGSPFKRPRTSTPSIAGME